MILRPSTSASSSINEPFFFSEPGGDRTEGAGAAMSRLYGRLAAAAVIAVGFPFHLLISLLIRLGDGGPALYRARRLGRSGVIYELLKYRSMKVGSKPVVTSDYKVVTVENDRRITRIGRILRCGLDELPQLYNVLRAEMAWIGPR